MKESERVHFKIALPVELKKRLEHISVENRRSLSAEIIARLETTLEMDAYQPGDNINPSKPDIVDVLLRQNELIAHLTEHLKAAGQTPTEPPKRLDSPKK